MAETRPIRSLIRSSTAEGFAAGGAAILAILGLAGILPEILLSIATIGIGAALLFQGSAIAMRWSEFLSRATRNRVQRIELGGGVTAEFLAGSTGIVLGILGLLGVVPVTLSAVAALVFGGGLILGSGVTARINDLRVERPNEPEAYWRVAQEAVSAATGVQMFVGVGSLVLGILSLVGIAPLVLPLVAMLGIGVATTMSGTAVCSRAMGYLPH